MGKHIPLASGTRLGLKIHWTNAFVNTFCIMKSYFLSHHTAHITGTHCPILHEPPPEHNFIFVPEDGSALTLLQSSYDEI